MAPSKKLKAEAKELGIPNYWRYGEPKLKELIAAKKPKSTPAKPKVAAKSTKLAKKKDNKTQILDHIAKCNTLIESERKLIKGPKSAQHYSMLDRSLASLKDVTLYLSKIQ